VWVFPIVAAVVGAWVAVTRILGEGPKITIVFQSAEGLEAGKTKIHYNGVEVGTLTTIRLSDDHQRVVTTAQMVPKTESFLVKDTKFWIVSPRISGANVTGLATLISGAYIGMEIGQYKERKRDFVALDTPPVVSSETAGRFFLLNAPNLGSLDTGTPIYFRRLTVGEVASYALDKDGKSLTVSVFVKAPYDQYVNPNTRFWDASGIDLSLTASGLNLQTQSLLSILVGGIAFETSANAPIAPAAEENTVFTLFNNRAEAFKLPARDPQTFVLIFKDSVRGLAPGAPVEFRGIPVGEVSEVRAQIDATTFEFSAPVTISVDAQRLGVRIVDFAPGTQFASIRQKTIETLVEHGVRAQLRSGSLLTGALYVAFDFFPDAPPVTLDWSQTPVELPTIPGELQAIEAKAANILKKLDEVPYKAIGDDLRKLMAELDRTLEGARGTLGKADTLVDNADKLVEPNSVLSAELGNTLQEVSRAARGLRVLADYLERHPEALIRGKPGEAK
jgi:paraquat-inducible protein B